MTEKRLIMEEELLRGNDNIICSKIYDVERDEMDKKPKNRKLFRQFLATSAPLIDTMGNGFVMGYSAILLPQLQQESSLIKVNPNLESWIASMAPLPMAFGCVLGGWSMERFGRKWTNIFVSFLTAISWYMIYLSTTLECLLIGRLLTGFCAGTSAPVIITYIGEVTHPKFRGAFLTGLCLALSCGLFLTHLLGTFFTWKTTALITISLPVSCLVIYAITPESHVWYANKNDADKAREAFFWYREESAESKRELEIALNKHEKDEDVVEWGDRFREMCTARFLKPLIILIVFFITALLSGNKTVIFYSVSIMKKSVPNLDEYATTLTVDLLRVVMSVAALFTSKRFSVRPLMIASGLGTAFSLYIISICVHLSSDSNKIYSLVSLLAFLAYVIFLSIGLLPLPWALCGELFPPITKGAGSGIAIAVNYFTFFAIIKISPQIFQTFGTGGTFAAFATFTLIGTSVLYFILPETKNKTLADIQSIYNRKPEKQLP